MFEELTAPTNVVAFRLTGAMTGDDIDKYQAFLRPKLDTAERIGMCVDMTGLSDLDAEAFTKGAKADIEFLAYSQKIGRVAIVSDKQWPHVIAGLYTKFLPGIELKVFDAPKRKEALTWAGEVATDVPVTTGSALRTFETSTPTVLGIEMTGTIGPEDLEPVIDELNAFFADHEKVRLVNRVRHLGFHPSIFFQSGLMSTKLAAMKKVERYAIVGAPTWVEKVAGTVNPMFDMDVRTFPASEEAEAWKWIGAKPKAARPQEEPVAGLR